MPQRPILSDVSFLGYLFSPAKHDKPRGLRRQTLKGTKNRNRKRLAAYNRMSAASQELLKRADLREEYLRGEATLHNAKETLRPNAVSLGVARPSRTSPGPVARPLTRREQLDAMIARHMKRTLATAGRRFNAIGIDQRVPRIPDYIAGQVPTWDYDQIRDAASNGSPFEVMVDVEANTRFNPFWYN